MQSPPDSPDQPDDPAPTSADCSPLETSRDCSLLKIDPRPVAAQLLGSFGAADVQLLGSSDAASEQVPDLSGAAASDRVSTLAAQPFSWGSSIADDSNKGASWVSLSSAVCSPPATTATHTIPSS